MISKDVWGRVFRLRFGQSEGTGVAIDLDGKQYLATARHVVSQLASGGTIEIMRHETWHKVVVTAVTHARGDVDVSLIAVPQILSAPHLKLAPSMDGLFYGGEVYFLGYPYGMYGSIGANDGWPLAFVKRATLSGISDPKTQGEPTLYLDGHNNPGFSGGPVVFRHGTELRLAGIVSGFQAKQEPVYMGGQASPLSYQYNTGIMIAWGSPVVTELARQNGAGFATNGY
ncbi:serine protease [Burkholderia gladioli]|uniref:S1 family peptidase n=1 Tax=Burkholderia gladioli TaxID=28095 RepID=UPI001C245F6E|nr:serine protease [Burkholderia gladioli]MBU9218904.1 serine protease [Burkholderia gladioli]